MIRINDSQSKSTLKAAFIVSVILLFAAAALGQQQINLTAAPTTATMPDGTVVPMWGYFCGPVVTGSTASCASSNPNSLTPAGVTPSPWAATKAYSQGNVILDSNGNVQTATTAGTSGATAPATWGTTTAATTLDGTVVWTFQSSLANYLVTATSWSPVVITVPPGQGLTINLTNSLSFTPAGSTTANTIPTSIVIVGQVGGGLGTSRTTTASPSHANVQGCPTWFIADPNTPPGVPCTANDSGAVPPQQGPRVQSMASEVAAGATSTLTWPLLKPGTYLLESGTHPSIQVPMGLIGMLVVTSAPTGAGGIGSETLGTAYPALGNVPPVVYGGEVSLEFSEIDPVQNKAVDQAVRTAGFSETAVWSGMNNVDGSGTPGCGQTHTCYPPAVNYTPLYYLINGLAFNKTNSPASVFSATAGVSTVGSVTAPATIGITNNVLVRLVNAGLRMHVPSIVGSQTAGFDGGGNPATVAGFGLVAEDGNPVPNQGAPRVQTDLFMAAGKTFDVMINVPQPPSAGAVTPDLPIYDRELSLSGNSSVRDAGMLAYISVNNLNGAAGLPITAGTGIFSAAQANPDTYDSIVPGQPFTVSDPSKGVIANDINVYGATLLTPPANGTLTCTLLGSVSGICANGTFTYTPNAGSNATSDTFYYCANVSASSASLASCPSNLMAKVTLGASTLTGNPTAISQTYTAKTATFLKIPSPGLLLGNSDPNNLPLTVVTSSAPTAPTNGSLTLDADGGLTLALDPNNTSATSFTFPYTVGNSQGRTATGTVTVNFPAPSNLQVTLIDAQAYNNCISSNPNGNPSACVAGLAPISDYRWIIEEDKTFWVDPNCTTNSSVATPGCPKIVGPAGQSTIPLFSTNFHTSAMDFVAQGCTGPLSCEGGQTMLDNRPACSSPGVPAGCSATAGQHIPAVCDVGNGACRPDTTGTGFAPVLPSSVHLDPTKRYYISVLPGDAANPFPAYVGQPVCGSTPYNSDGSLNTQCGHSMSGAPIPPACNMLTTGCTSASTTPFAAVTVKVLPTPLPTGKLSVMVFEDDFPLNGEQDSGGGVDVISPQEPGLGGFNIVLWDTYGTLGDVTGQDTNDMFNQPLSNALAGTIDPSTGLDACPISANPLTGPTGAGAGLPGASPASGMTGMIVTCPKYESDGETLSPLAGQAIIENLMPDKFGVQAYPGADRIARGEEWLQTNTLDGQHPHDTFVRAGEPTYFQEYGPAGYHAAIGFANPALINARHDAVCSGAFGAVGGCGNTITGQVVAQRMSRIPDERLYPSGSPDRRELAFTQCWVSLGDPDAEDFMFTKCDANGNFVFNNVPGGNWRLTLGDQWNDQIVDGLATPANVGCIPTSTNTCTGQNNQTLNMGQVVVQQWQANVYTRTFIDDNKNGIWDPGEIGIPLIYTRVYYRDGHNANGLNTDFNGVANFNETFPLFNWYVVEADSTRYKTTGIHTVYDAGGPADGSVYCSGASQGGGNAPCGTSTAYQYMANTYEKFPLPTDLSVPGAVYCSTADCKNEASSFAAGTPIPSSGKPGLSTGRIDPPWVWSEGVSLLLNQGAWVEFGKAPYAACNPASGNNPANNSYCATVPNPLVAGGSMLVGENGGIEGQVTYASTRPFDDASQMILQPWEPLVPHVTINLYQEGFAADGVTPTLTLVDTTQTSSWDDWAQGFYPNSTAGSGTGAGQKPYLSCPGQGTAATDVFFYTLYDQPQYLDWYNSQHNGGTLHTLPYNSQFKCYDAMKIFVQTQPAPYDGHYSFPSSLGVDPTSGKLLATFGSTNGQQSSMAGTNCTVCVANPDKTDNYRYGTPMLPPGKYQVHVIMPPGYEVYKEEDKNLLIGDNFIAPVTQQFGGLGADIFIIPDQASVASMYDESNAGYNPTNFQDQTTGLGLSDELSGVPGYPGFQDPVWPCVGEQRVVPDYLSIFPQAKEVAPFAGAVRPLCDRKEVNLASQMSVRMHFAIFTSTHIAGHFTGVITDDFTSEFDPFAPMFGEKFSPPNLPVSTRDYMGNEISRVYSDHFGIFDGLTFSSWEVNPPNITGYSPSMMVQCMNDPGPILDTNPSSATYGQMINDPLFNPAYSDFCYELPYMPGLTSYLDTPVVPTQAFVGAGYNNIDCAYPDTTPAIAEADGDGIGPWVSAAGKTLTITSLGDQQVPNHAYAGPSGSVAPFNLKTVNRHYGFGTTKGTVTIGGQPATVTNWNDSTITVTVPNDIPLCQVQQQAQYAGSGITAAQCGELIITAANGRQSIDTVTVTVGGKQPTHVPASGTIQAAIDAAAPGDLLIVDPTCATGSGGAAQAVPCTNSGVAKSNATHTEMLIMWKPVRLQGVGAATSIINANTQPSGKLLDPWRRHINCFFGLTLQGSPYTAPGGGNPYDPSGAYSCPETGWNYFSAQPNNPQIDRLPLEAVIGWDATLNGNLAELLQEPSLMGAYEGAGITVLAKGLEYHGQIPWNDGIESGAFPTQTTMLTGLASNPGAAPGTAGALLVGDANPYCHTGTYSNTGAFTITSQTNPYPSNFSCNPSSIDGLGITNSSQGGGGVFVHGWAHYLQVANNRVFNNSGTLTGGITVGQGEFAPPYILGGTTNAAPGSCSNGTGLVTNQHEPYCLQLQVNVHNNYIAQNSAIGDELFSATLSGSGAATFCTGNDYYKFQYNWICGNISAGEGGGMVHLGEIFNGDIEHNSFVFNQSSNPTIPTNGGAIMVQGTPDTDPVCPGVADTDCPPGLSDGTGPGLVINANLIQGNSADSGSGGGIRLQQVNGTDVNTFAKKPQYWHDVTVTNNIIVNNIAGWDGAGISLQDALKVNIVNNTIAHNDSLATSGVLANSIGASQASAPSGNCVQNGPTGPTTASCPQSAGVTSTPNSSLLLQAINGLTITCPTGHPNCQAFSDPALWNDLIYQNRSFFVGITGSGSGELTQANLLGLFNQSGTPAALQTSTGACSNNASYWDVGVRGDSAPGNHNSGFTITPHFTMESGGNPRFISQYCNGSRVPPECTAADGCGGPSGFGVPPGIADSLVQTPKFSFTPNATVDEGNNWINVSWGPLSLSNPSIQGPDGNWGGGPALGNYGLTPGSNAIDRIPVAENLPAGVVVPTTDYYGNPRPNPDGDGTIDYGAVETQGGASVSPTLSSITPTSGYRGTSVNVTIAGTGLTGASAVHVSGSGITVTGVGVVSDSTVVATFDIATTASLSARNVTVTTPNGTAAGTPNPVTFTVLQPTPTLTGISPTSGAIGTAVQVTLTGTNLSGGAVHVSGGGFTVSGVTSSPDGTSITATLTISGFATPGPRNITVTAGGINSNAEIFTVTPYLTGFSPTTLTHGTNNIPVTLTGTGLSGSTAIEVSGTGVTCSVSSSTSSSITGACSVTSGANRTSRNVRATTPAGNTNTLNGAVTVN